MHCRRIEIQLPAGNLFARSSNPGYFFVPSAAGLEVFRDEGFYLLQSPSPTLRMIAEQAPGFSFGLEAVLVEWKDTISVYWRLTTGITREPGSSDVIAYYQAAQWRGVSVIGDVFGVPDVCPPDQEFGEIAIASLRDANGQLLSWRPAE